MKPLTPDARRVIAKIVALALAAMARKNPSARGRA